MSNTRLLPPLAVLERLVEQGMTHQEIADWVFETTGNRVARSTVAVALSRAGKTTSAARYARELPWRVSQEHQMEYPARMLRLLGRRRAGKHLSGPDNVRLDGWLRKVEGSGAVVAYAPHLTPGFVYVLQDAVDPRLVDWPIYQLPLTERQTG